MMDTTLSDPKTANESPDPGDRVVILQGDWMAMAATVLHPDPEYYRWGVWVLLVENGDKIAIHQYSFVRSPYQNEPLEEVPIV